MSLKPQKVDFNSTWTDLMAIMKAIINLEPVHRSDWNDKFSDIYSLCVALPEPYGESLYREIKRFLEDHVKLLCQDVENKKEDLTVYHDHWLRYYQGSKYLNHLCMYLNNQYICKLKIGEVDYGNMNFGISPSADDILEIGQTALKIWKEKMLKVVHEPLLRLLLKGIENDRLGSDPNQMMIEVISSFHIVENYKIEDLDYYIEIFEEPFLKDTEDYYQRKASILAQENNFSGYMEKVIALLDAEKVRSLRYLHPSSVSKVKSVCQNKLVADHIDLFKSECCNAVEHENLKDLKNLFVLLKPVDNGLEPLKNAFQEHVTKIGTETIANMNTDNVPHLFVSSTIQIHSKYTKLIHNVFSGDQQFIGALDQACSKIVNYPLAAKNICNSPELLAKYTDRLLKKNNKGMTEYELDEKISQSITVFKYLDNKDEFHKGYSRMLAKRLIFGLSTSRDAEEQMLSQLRQACGFEFTSKMNRMFSDISVSGDLKDKFSSYLTENQIDLAINVSFYILQDGAWPFAQGNRPSFSVPQQLEKCIQVYEKFYDKSFNGRKLYWLHSVSSAELKLRYLKKPYLVTMGTLQMAILLLFEDTDTCSYSEIHQIIKLDPENLKKQLQSLIEAKLLLASSSESPLSEECTYTLNMDYHNKRTKFKINASIHKESAPELERENNRIAEDRKSYLQATIVRIMKHRQQIRHNSLIEETLRQAKKMFVPTVVQIKKIIEVLIEKHYIDRMGGDQDLYRYVA